MSSGGTTITSLAEHLRQKVAVESGTTEQMDAQTQSAQVHARQARRRVTRARVPDPEQRQPGGRQRARATRLRRLAGRRVPGRSSPRHVQARRRRRSRTRPTASRCRRAAASTRPILARCRCYGRTASTRRSSRSGACRRRDRQPGDQRGDELAQPGGRGDLARAPPTQPRRPGGLSEIKAVPVRHPGRWVAARDHPRDRGGARALGRQQRATSSGAVVGAIPVRRARSCTGCA